MNDLIATIIESWFSLFINNFSNEMFKLGEYGVTGWVTLIIPIVLLFVFYKIIDKIGGKTWHYILALIFTLVSVYFSSVGMLYGSLVAVSNLPGFECFVFTYSLYITIVSLVPIIFGTFGLRFISNNNRYNPF